MASDRNASVPYTNLKDTYLSTRREQLKDSLKEIEHFRPVSKNKLWAHKNSKPYLDEKFQCQTFFLN